MPTIELEIRRATFAPSTFNEKDRTAEVIFSTGARVQRMGYIEALDMTPRAVDLSRFIGGAVLDSHRQGSLADHIGVITAARIEAGQGIATIKFSERASAIMADIRDGIIRHVSVGYRVTEWRETTENGQRVKTASRWQPLELSVVSLPADPGAIIRSQQMPDIETLDNPATKPPVETRASMAALRTIQRSLGMDDAWLDSQVEANATEEQARAAADEIVRARAVRISSIRSPEAENPAVQRQNREDALFARITGTTPADGARQHMGLSIVDMGAEMLQAQGVATRGLSREELYRRAMGKSDLPLLLQGVGDRFAVSEYQSLASPLGVLFATRSATDFRDLHNLKFDGDGVGFRSLTEHAEIKKVTFKESGESYSLDTFAMGWDWTRQAIINDDLGMLARGPSIAGRLAAEKTTAQYVGLVESNPNVEGAAMFSTGRGNLASSGTGIIAGSGSLGPLSAARLALRMMKGLDGVTPIASTPKYLIVHPERETEAEQALTQLAATNVEEVNPFSGKLTLLVEPRLTSEDAWYVAAGNGQNFERAFLNGREGPTVESNPAWDTLGVSFRSWFDLGVGVRDWRFVYKNAGA